MKSIKNIIAMGLVCCGLAAAANAQAQQYTITGNVSGLADGTVLLLTPMSHDKEQPLGEATVAGGQFKFTGTATEPILVNVTVKDCYGVCTLMLENAAITVSGSASKQKAWDGTDLYEWKTTVGGSPLTDQYKTLMSERDKLNQLHAANQEKFAHVHQKMNELKDEAERKAYQQSDDYKAMLEADRQFFHAADSVLNGLILSQKETFWGPLLATANMSYFTPDQRKLYNQFSETAKNSWYGRKMKEELWPAGTVGQPIEGFTVKDDKTGQETTFAKLAEGKKYVLIDFWASWCAPCRKEIPNVKRQYALYKDKGFEVVSISIDRSADAWRKAVAEEQLEWPNYLSTEVADKFKVKAVPTMLLVDNKGVIIAENNDARGEALATKLAELFK